MSGVTTTVRGITVTPTNDISKCANFIGLFKSGGKFLIRSMRCRADPVFLGQVVSRTVRRCNIYIKPVSKRCKNARFKSR